MEITFFTLVKIGIAISIGKGIGQFCYDFMLGILDATLQSIIKKGAKENIEFFVRAAKKYGLKHDERKTIGFKY